MDSNAQNNDVGYNKKRDILLDALSFAPPDWEKDMSSFRSLCVLVPVHGRERKTILAPLPEHLRDKASVYRFQNPFMLGRYVLRREQLLARGIKLRMRRRYHPIFEVDKRIVQKYNLDWRRYYDGFGKHVQEDRSPILYDDPSNAMNSVYEFCSKKNMQVILRKVVLVVVSVLEEESDDLPELIKIRDTEYCPEYFIGFN